MSHTPGPWEYDVRTGNIQLSNLQRIAVVSFSVDDGHLIAAAPDLLAALKECVDCLDKRAALPEYDDRYIFLSELNIRDRARLAIAEAEGKT